MRPRARLYLLSILVQLAIAPFVVHDWDGFVFSRSVRDFLHGATPYAVAEVDPAYIHLSNAWPPLNTWFAYPPLALLLMTPGLALAFGLGAPPWLERVALKLPFVAGTLLLAWVGARLLRSWGKDPQARVWERLVLFNPFLLFISAAWGMFDAWMVALLLLSVLLLHEGRVAQAGVAFGASALIKLFPLFAAPMFLLYVARRAPGRMRDGLRFASAAAATFAAVSLPFFVPHPRGFFLQVLRMHLERPPQGLSLPSLFVESGRWAASRGWLSAEPSGRTLATLSFGVTLAVLLLTSAAAWTARSSETLVRTTLGLLLGVLFTSKVLNEQYFVIPVALYALLACSSGAPWARSGYRAFTVGGLAASLLMGWHFITFLAPDVSDRLLGERGYALVAELAAASGLSPASFVFVPTALSFLALLPAVVAAFGTIARECRAGVRVLAALVGARLHLARRWSTAVVAVVAAAPVLAQTAALGSERPEATAPLSSEDRHVGVFYYLWWVNPSRDPARIDGNWHDGVSETPAEGYYTANSAKLRNDFRLARSNGVDLVVTSFHEYDLPILPTALRAAYDQNVVVAPLVELGEIYSRSEYRSVDEGFTMQRQTAAAIVDLASKALELFARAPAAYRPGGKLAVFLYDSYFSGGDWRPSSNKEQLERVVAMAAEDARRDHATSPSRADLERSTPANFRAMLDDARYGYLWRRAYAQTYQEFWRGIRGELEKRFGPLLIFSGESWNAGAPFHRGAQTALDGFSVFDATFVYSPSFVSVLHRRDSYERNWERWVVRATLQAQYARGAGRPVVATVIPAYDDRVMRPNRGFEIPPAGPRGDTYDLMWDFAATLHPDLVLVTSWNEFFEGTAIEPTREHGDAFVRRTLAWSRAARASARRDKRGLVITGEASSHYAPGIADPSVEGRYAHNVQLVAERDLPDYSFDARDAGSSGAPGVDLSPYALVLVEAGLDDQSPAVASLVERVAEWVRAGGRVLVSGASAGGAWEKLTGARGATLPASSSALVANDGTTIALPPGSHPLAEGVADDASVLLRYADGDARGRPAAWSRQVGAGAVIATSMHVTGRDKYPATDATAVLCACVRPLIAPSDRCENTRADIVP
jgi:hypothetical protein